MQFNFYYRATATSHCSGLHFDPLSFTAALQVFGSAALFMHSSLSSGLWTVTEPSFVSFAAVLGVIVLFMTQFGPSFGRGFMETQWLQGDETLIAPSPCQQVIQRVCPDMTCLILPTHAAHDEQTSPICSRSLQRLCKPDPCCRVPFGEMFSLPNKPHLFSRLLIVLSWTLTFNRWPEAREVWALHCANTPESFRTAKCPNVYTYTGAHSCWGAVSLIPLEFPHDSKNHPVTDVTRQELHVFTITSYYVLVQRARLLCMTLLWHGTVFEHDGLTCLKLRKGTNWTMSRRTGSPLGERRIPSSPSSICMSLKSAFPTPTMMMDMGRWEAWTMASLVSAMSVMTPSVRISRMKYCWRIEHEETQSDQLLRPELSV